MLNIVRYLALSLLTFGGIAAQLAVESTGEPLPKTPPAAEAEAESKSEIDPDDAYRELVSGDAVRVVRAYHALDLSWIGESLPVDVRAMAVNMDDDKAHLERVLIINNLSNTAVIVFTKKNGGWWRVISGLCGAPTGNCPSPFVELKQTVWYGTYDLVVHTDGKMGLGVSESHLQIYRMFQGRFYRVFDYVESAHNMSGEESSKFRFSDVSSLETATIVVHQSKEFRGRRSATCIPHIWNVEKFAFLPVPPTRALCAPVN